MWPLPTVELAGWLWLAVTALLVVALLGCMYLLVTRERLTVPVITRGPLGLIVVELDRTEASAPGETRAVGVSGSSMGP